MVVQPSSKRLEKAEAKMQDNIKIAAKGILWAFLTVFFGLLELWFVIAAGLIKKDLFFPYEDFILGGGLLFFASAITTSLMVDYHLSGQRLSTLELVDFFIFTLFPFIIVVVSTFVFSVSYTSSPKDLEIELLRSIEIALVTMSIIYAIFIKCIEYRKVRK